MSKIKNICCIGAGYVGGPTMSVIAYKSPQISVTVVDVNKSRINAWNGDVNNLPIYEPGLADIVKETRGKNLFFSTNINESIKKAEMIFIAVNTPTKTHGIGKGMASDLKYVELCARKIAEVSQNDKIIVEKSTLPVRTAETIKKILKSNSKNINFEILSNPEFLAEGTAINDLLYSDRVLIGSDQTKSGLNAAKSLSLIYENWLPKNKIIKTNLWSSELSKLVANAFLAQRISSINSISALCEKTGADIDQISETIGKDSRIGPKFLKSSVGFGGSCFKKDILNLVYIANHYGLHEVAEYWHQVVKINNYQKNRLSEKIISTLFDTVNDKIITIYGWAFKKDTNDSRESAAIDIANKLIDDGAIINVFDPMVKKERIIADLKELWSLNGNANDAINNKLENINVFNDHFKAARDSHAIVIITEWDIFKTYDWSKIYRIVKKPAFIFDGRNILSEKKINKFNLISIGK